MPSTEVAQLKNSRKVELEREALRLGEITRGREIASIRLRHFPSSPLRLQSFPFELSQNLYRLYSVCPNITGKFGASKADNQTISGGFQAPAP